MKLPMDASSKSSLLEMLSLFFQESTYKVCVSKQQHHRSVTSKVKRSIDILGSLLGLAIAAVVAVPVAVAMLLDNPGPLLYSQVRCSFKGRHFRIWKFRSMVVGAENLKHLVSNQAQGHIFKNENDPRITRVGRFLRSTSLDELPQFWNVLVGDMSLVGTRPPTPDEVAAYDEFHWQRLNVKPGLTGEWQVNGRSRVKDFDEIVRMDLDYQGKWSVVYDITLICKTIWVVLSKNGAC
ncbi:Undecaprenyl-phosphate galactose phosphotransferase [Oscillatoria nigro-viridis PCC 7112]|uniref:Undecaprenyl-phosphate galactose phosphotransferase n=1 Tax=Phormidium nigroviride PCC 7112 TaxID=179408 RepID=K9VH08_9CYAN|nr:sugar transferase [Oscillatoria nigro-viridis]AFZ07378.1 Undecaprenyl-phosphate galactose phosphotransferase [Oscillatoria nigro-viridis PCC 7112]